MAACMDGGELSEDATESFVGYVLDSFVDGPEIKNLIERVQLIHGDELAFEAVQERFRFLLDKYQEQPHLLDKSLDELLGQLLNIAVAKNAPRTLADKCFKLLYMITKVRNYKYVVGHLPHEVSDVELALGLINQQNPTDLTTWESRYMLLLWLSIIVMIPFHMTRLDGEISSEEAGRKTVMQRIFDIITEYIPVGDKPSDAAAFLAAKFITRPDSKESYLGSFIDWTLKAIGESTTTRSTIGALTALALVYKHGKRDDLLRFTPKIFFEIQKYDFKSNSSILIRKLSLKLTQRIGLTFLKPRVASWRYQRGSRSIAINLESSNSSLKDFSEAKSAVDDESEDYNVAEEVEEVLQQLLDGIRDSETIVRWSAAKGVGRITGRLPKELADEVVGSVLEMFNMRENDGAWHGGCLALAELGRRGLLLPERLPDVVPIVIRALVYDEQRGNFSVGSHVRDAACYVCWSFARAYEPSEMQPYVAQIASALLIVTMFDRQVNCRRAAAAAFQENVGRQGTFPHGIDILTTADYFSVSSRVTCYLKLSVHIAQYPEYTSPLIKHLIERKINHCDTAIRELSARSLHFLTPKDPTFTVEYVLPFILPLTTGLDTDSRHGSIMAVGEIIHALTLSCTVPIKTIIGKERVEEIKNISASLVKHGMLKGLGGEMTKQAVFHLIEKLSLAKMPFHTDEILGIWQNMFNDSFHFADGKSQSKAVFALPPFCSEYYRGQDGEVLPGYQDIVVQYATDMVNNNSCNTTIGLAMALNAMPKFMLRSKEELVIKSLIECATITPKTALWVSARSEAVKCLANICVVVDISDAEKYGEGLGHSVFECLLSNLRDYTRDSRGDSGAGVREAAMMGLQVLVTLLTCNNPRLLTEELCTRIMTGLAQQAVEKIDRTRQLACQVFYNLFSCEPQMPNVPDRNELTGIFPPNFNEWKDPSLTFPMFSQLLSLPVYSKSVLLGLVVSVGGLAESQIKHSSPALFSYLKCCQYKEEKLREFCDNLLEIFRDNLHDDRVTLPLLKTLDQVLVAGSIDGMLANASSSFSMYLIRLIKAETNNSGNHPKLMASVPVLCELLKCDSKCRKKVLEHLSIMLCHRFASVRKETAAVLYEALLANCEVVDDEEVLQSVMGILEETNWDESVNVLRPIRNKLCDLLQIPKPVPKAAINKS